MNIPSGLVVESTYKSFVDICSRFRESVAGKKLSVSSRWLRCIPEGMSEQTWMLLLGRDANGFDHMVLTYEQVRRALVTMPHDMFTQEEAAKVLFVALVHDLGEAEVGDINYNLKTDSDEKKEMQVLRKILEDNGYGDAADWVIEIIKKRGTKLGKFFNVIERLGYVSTGIHCWRLADCLDNIGLQQQLRWLSADTLANHLSHLYELRGEFFFIDDFFQVYIDTIEYIINRISKDMFLEEVDEKRMEKYQKIQALVSSL